MAVRQDRNRQRATAMAKQAVGLQRGAELLLDMNQPHAAHLLACHAGISGADAISILETGEAHGGDHRRSGQTLLEADQTLKGLAKKLDRLSDEKNTIAYKHAERNVPRHEEAVRDSRAIVEEACSRLDIEMPPRIRASKEIRTLEELRKGVLAVLDERRMKPDQDPWQTLLSLLEALRPAFGDRDLDAILADIRKTTAAN